MCVNYMKKNQSTNKEVISKVKVSGHTDRPAFIHKYLKYVTQLCCCQDITFWLGKAFALSLFFIITAYILKKNQIKLNVR